MVESMRSGRLLFAVGLSIWVVAACLGAAMVRGQGSDPPSPTSSTSSTSPTSPSSPLSPPVQPPQSEQTNQPAKPEEKRSPAPPAATPDLSQPPSNPREMLRGLGVDDRSFDALVDGVPVAQTELDTVLRVLLRLRTFPKVNLDRWAQDSRGLADAAAKPQSVRENVFRLRGRLIAVEACRPEKETADRFDLSLYYRCRIEIENTDAVAEVFAEDVPKAWQRKSPINAQSGAIGVFLKYAGDDEGRPVFVFVAPRMAWYPDEPLANAGMDFGLFDGVEDGKTLAAGERDAFYDILAVAGRTKPGQLLRQADAALSKTDESLIRTTLDGKRRYSVATLFNEPNTQRGRLLSLSGTVRRIEEILVDDPEIVARYGFDRYYQIALFTDDSQGNPLMFCVRELPKGMPYGNLPEYSEAARIAGFFFKTWSYTLPPLAGQKAKGPRKQQAPLLIGRDVAWSAASKPGENNVSTAVIVAVVVGLMITIWVGMLRSQKEDRRWIDGVVDEHPKLDAILDFENLPSHHDDQPDFSRLAELDRGREGAGTAPITPVRAPKETAAAPDETAPGPTSPGSEP